MLEYLRSLQKEESEIIFRLPRKLIDEGMNHNRKERHISRYRSFNSESK